MVDMQQQGERAMLSRAEQQFIKSPDAFNSDYQRILRHRIKVKMQRLKLLMPLLEARGFWATADCNGVTKFCNGERGLNQAAYSERLVRSPRFEPGSSAWQADRRFIDYRQVKSGFICYLDSRNFNKRYVKCILSYLDKYATAISEPSDIHKMFGNLTAGQQHNLNRGVRNLFNYAEAQGASEAYLDLLRKNLPKEQIGVDLNVPEESDIIESLKRLPKASPKYAALYNLLLDSGLRLVEAAAIVNDFKGADKVNGFYRATVGMFRGSKQAYYAYFTEPTYKQLVAVSGSINPYAASHYILKCNFIAAKYLRKFAFDKMVQLEVPESVADFIEGRVAKRIGAKHYMVLRRQADNFYGKYAGYLSGLRST